MVSFYFRVVASFISVFIVALLIWLIVSVNNTEEELRNSIEKSTEKSITQEAKKIVHILKTYIRNSDKDLPYILGKNRDLRQIVNQNLEIIRNDKIPYIYLLYLDKKGKFRYIADGSKKKSHFYQKFDPGNLAKWQNIYNSTKITLLDQSCYDGLWKSMLIPIVKDKKNIAMLVVDYSVKLPNSIKNIISPLKNFLLIVFFAIIFLIALVAIEVLQIYLINKKSYKDSLTGVYNRDFLNYISGRISLEKYHIIMIDLDYFKKVNDLYGHLIGDQALKHVTQIVKKFIHKKDYFIRFGGEEFIVLLKIRKSRKGTLRVAELIRKTLAKTPFQTKQFGQITIKASIGVNQNTKEEKSIESAIKNADMALYEAKKSGRNCVKETIISKQIKKNIQNYNFSYIKSLIDKELVCCYFQPLFSNQTKKIVKYEVLARIKDEDGNLIMPNDFLPSIWKTNIYQKFTKQVIENSIRIFKSKKENFSINLGLQDILNEDILSIIKEIAQKEPQTIKKMGIEILEYDRFEDVDRLGKILRELKNLGISIILDDFGSGHANFTIVERLDFDEIKIDGAIVEHINENPRSKALLELLADFAIKSHLKTTVEYVSSKEIYDSIIKIPFTHLQGFYLGKPQEL